MPDLALAERRRISIAMTAWEGLVTADVLAARHGVQPRTIYRDIARLRSSGVPIKGEAGIGYMIPRNPFSAIERNLERMGR